MEWIIEAESKEDLVDGYGLIGEELVRCKDCKSFHKYGFHMEYTECIRFDCGVSEDGYCSWGERKDDESHPFADDVMMGERKD